MLYVRITLDVIAYSINEKAEREITRSAFLFKNVNMSRFNFLEV